jgi:AraC-like DNA-binding protein
MTKDIQKYTFKEGLPQEFEILDLANLYELSFDKMTSPHRLEFYQIIWFQEGNSTHFIDFNSIETEANTIIFLNKNSVQKYDTTQHLKGKVLLFTDSFFCRSNLDTQFLKNNILFNDLLSIPKIDIDLHTSTIPSIFKNMEFELSHKKDHLQSDILRNLLKNLLSYSERDRRNQGFTELPKDINLEYILLFRELIDEHYIKNRQVNFYCDCLNITPKRLNYATTKVFGKTPKEIINDKILLEIKRLLIHTNDTVKEIGFNLGFEEPTNFVKYFKKNIGKTPKEFRDSFISN